MRKIILTLLLLLLPAAALAEGMHITAPADAVRPGKACLITFEVPQAGPVDITLTDDAGEVCSTVVLGLNAAAGVNQVWWNGTYVGAPAPQGSWQLVLTQQGSQAAAPVTVGPQAPYLTAISASAAVLTPDAPLTVSFYAACEGWLSAGVWQNDQWQLVGSWAVTEGSGAVEWDGSGLDDGAYTLTLLLTDPTGDSSHEEQLPVTLMGFSTVLPQVTEAPVPELAEDEDLIDGESEAEDMPEAETPPAAQQASVSVQQQYTPAYGSPYAGVDPSFNFWTLPMDITDEEAVWAMLTSPITVVDIGSKSGEKVQAYLRALPQEDADYVGVVTCETQGVHVLKTLDNGWSLVECYSSSFHDTKVKAWNALVQGYIKSSWLKQVTPNQELGFVIDKLTQRLYIFKNGRLFDTLLVSTGIANAKQPYNETRSGEFITASKVGEFASDNLKCSMAVRFNSGDLLHEVPHILNADGTSNYKAAESKLGTKASHGCVRVQRNKTPQGVNMKWIWSQLKSSSKCRLVIWEDWQGRQIPLPDADLTLYYNPKGGNYYHSQETCYMAKGKTFSPFSYSELDTGDFAALKRCNYCNPALRMSEIEAINAEYLPGGDHDPVMTKAREKYYELMDSIATDLVRN